MTQIDDYDFELPRELVAQHPLAHRSDARLMLVNRKQQSISHYHVRDLPDLLESSVLPDLADFLLLLLVFLGIL